MLKLNKFLFISNATLGAPVSFILLVVLDIISIIDNNDSYLNHEEFHGLKNYTLKYSVKDCFKTRRLLRTTTSTVGACNARRE